MPATEQTWRNVKLMHVLFGVSGLAMFLTTIWMLAADHIRPWKPYQRTYQGIENWRSKARITEEQSDDFSKRLTALQEALAATQASAPPKAAVDRFAAELRAGDKPAAADEVNAAYSALAASPTAEGREKFVTLLRSLARQARFDEDNIALRLKFRKADLDVARADYELGVGGDLSTEQLNLLQAQVDIITRAATSQPVAPPSGAVEQSVNYLTAALQAASTHRKSLDAALAAAVADEAAARKALADHNATLEQLQKTYATLRRPSRSLLTLPIIDAFNSPLEIKQIWLPNLTIKNGSFGTVARFDRCTTCHQGIDRTAPGSPVAPFFEHQRTMTVAVATPETAPTAEVYRQGITTSTVYGLVLAEGGLLNDDDVTVEVVWPQSAAARAQLLPGDVIQKIGNVKLTDRGDAERYLLESVNWGQPLQLTIARGLPHPYSSHPRLDLYLGSTSPHKTEDFGCTICHDGQGSATAFKWASHTPNDLLEMEEWQDEHGWFHNHHWTFPMQPERFLESNCLKCHHEVVDLAPSERYPDPPAPKLMAGYELIRQYGCYGCHEINGYDGPDKRIGPDLRTEPNYAAAAQQLLSDQAFGIGAERLETEAADLGRQIAESVLDDDAAEEALAALANKVSLNADNLTDVRLLVGLVAAQEELSDETRAALAEAREALDSLTTIDEAAGLAQAVIDDPTADASRRRLLEILKADAPPESASAASAGGEVFSPTTHALATVLSDVEAPGALRKPGPSLRYVGSKLEREFLYDWIANPANFRPTTRMPRFFGLLDHLREEPHLDDDGHPILVQEVDAEGHDVRDEEGQPVTRPEMQESPGLAVALKYEPLEIRAAAEYLLHVSQAFDYLDRPEEIDDDYEPSVERGRKAFQLRGCLACHQHGEATRELPGASATQGPDLTRIGAKLSQAEAEPLYGWETQGARWLYSWVKQPNRYHTRTVMPDLFLDPIQVEGEWTDPAADLTAYLLASQADPAGEDAEAEDADGDDAEHDDEAADANATPEPWRPGKLPELNEADLRDLVLEHLRDKFTNSQSERYADDGIPDELAGEIKGDEALLIGQLTDQNRVERHLQYVGRRTIAKYGCAGCHDIPGFEDAKPKGTGLADWARKDLSQLAFEQISAYITRHGDFANGHGGHGHESLRDLPPDTGYLLHALLNHRREGFLWQKLREPRGYDYKKTENKKYNERLQMPKFNFTQEQIEQVMTFVLGLVAEPPAAQYVYNPPPRERALIAGRKALEKFNCAGCHELQGDRWEFEFDPAYAITEGDQPYAAAHLFPADEYEVFRPEFTHAELAASAAVDRRGMGRATITARKELDSEGNPAEFEDDDGNILNSFELWKPAAINGQPWLPSEKVLIRTDWITRHRPPEGGDLARLIYPVVLEEELDRNPARAPADVWGWVPPPLIHQGIKVQSDWLHDFLLDPFPIRPATVLRMGKFNMSPAEATALVNYFAAVDNAEYPYEFDSRRRQSHLAAAEAQYPGRLEDALRIATNGNYCVQCHLVGEYVPTRVDKAPNLARVHERIRPEYLEPWLSNPKRLLPYTGMPVNFPLLKPIDPARFPEAGELIQQGGSPQQLEAVMDLLLNYDTFMKDKFAIAPLVTAPDPEQPADAAAPADDAAEAADDDAAAGGGD